jgi:hypothetical protein
VRHPERKKKRNSKKKKLHSFLLVGEVINASKIVIRKTGKMSFGRLRLRWKDNIKMYLTETE